jgi:hypothetical protein
MKDMLIIHRRNTPVARGKNTMHLTQMIMKIPQHRKQTPKNESNEEVLSSVSTNVC